MGKMEWSVLQGASIFSLLPPVFAYNTLPPLLCLVHTYSFSRNALQPHFLQEAFPDGTPHRLGSTFLPCASQYPVFASLIFTSQYNHYLSHCLCSTPVYTPREGRKEA